MHLTSKREKRDTDRETRTLNPRIRSPMRYPIAPGRLVLEGLSVHSVLKVVGHEVNSIFIAFLHFIASILVAHDGYFLYHILAII